MTLRYLAVVLMLAVIGAGLLGLRQQQLNDRHAMAVSHAEMKSSRENIKDLQVRIAKLTTPEALRDAIDRSRLDLQPITKQSDESGPATPEAATTATPSDTTPTDDEARDG